MKRRIILFTLVMISFVGVMNAQNRTSFPVRYQGEVQFGFSPGVGTLDVNRINFQMINGIKLGEYLSTGIGTGFDVYMDFLDETRVAIPIYLNVKGYLPVAEQISLFGSMDIGTSIGLGELDDLNGGLLFVPAVGARFELNQRHAITASLGYNVQRWSVGGFENTGFNTNAIQLKVGFSF